MKPFPATFCSVLYCPDTLCLFKMIEVYSTYDPGQIAVIKSILDGEGIPYFFSGENVSLMIATGAYARLLVDEDQADRVRDILGELGFL
jgi:hypothetical protein